MNILVQIILRSTPIDWKVISEAQLCFNCEIIPWKNFFFLHGNIEPSTIIFPAVENLSNSRSTEVNHRFSLRSIAIKHTTGNPMPSTVTHNYLFRPKITSRWQFPQGLPLIYRLFSNCWWRSVPMFDTSLDWVFIDKGHIYLHKSKLVYQTT